MYPYKADCEDRSGTITMQTRNFSTCLSQEDQFEQHLTTEAKEFKRKVIAYLRRTEK